MNRLPVPKRIVDLSTTITEDLPVRISGPRMLGNFGFRESTRFEHVTIEEPLYVQASYLELFTHAGTHVDAPNHMERGTMGVDGYDLGQLIGPGRVVDLRSFEPDQPVSRSVLEAANLEPNEIAILFVGYEPPTTTEAVPSYPYLSPEAVRYLAALPIKAFATDAIAPDNPTRIHERIEGGARGNSDVVPGHHALLTRGIPIIEALTNLEELVAEDPFIFVAFPLKIADGNGSPTRAAALIY